MSSPRVHDPLFHFETHFPERLSRLHLNPEMCPPVQGRRSKRSRARHGIRYKTQPVTFDEITEVDEEGTSATEENNNKDGIKSQFAAFSRSMDGLVPKFKTKDVAKGTTSSRGQSMTRSSSGGITQSPAHVLESRLQEEQEDDKENKENEPEENSSSPPSSNTTSGIAALPPSGLAETRDPRRQRMTAKAKRRQMMAEAVDKES